MKKLSDIKLLPIEIGSTVRISVPANVDKGRLDAGNILAVVTEVHFGNILSRFFFYYYYS